MRVTSSLWVGAYVRGCQSRGAVATLVRRGAEEAGAIFLVVERLDGTADLYGPAPQSSFAEPRPADRRFEPIMEKEPLEAVTARLERETGFDPDLWIVAVEDRDGRSFFETM